MDYHKTTIALIAWLVWGGDKKTQIKLAEMSMISLSKNVNGNIKDRETWEDCLFGLRRSLKVYTKYFHRK